MKDWTTRQLLLIFVLINITWENSLAQSSLRNNEKLYPKFTLGLEFGDKFTYNTKGSAYVLEGLRCFNSIAINSLVSYMPSRRIQLQLGLGFDFQSFKRPNADVFPSQISAGFQYRIRDYHASYRYNNIRLLWAWQLGIDFILLKRKEYELGLGIQYSTVFNLYTHINLEPKNSNDLHYSVTNSNLVLESATRTRLSILLRKRIANSWYIYGRLGWGAQNVRFNQQETTLLLGFQIKLL